MTEDKKILMKAAKKVSELHAAERFIEITIASALAAFILTQDNDLMILSIVLLMVDMVCETAVLIINYLAERKVRKIMSALNRQVEKAVFNYSDNYLAEELYEFESEYGFLHK